MIPTLSRILDSDDSIVIEIVPHPGDEKGDAAGAQAVPAAKPNERHSPNTVYESTECLITSMVKLSEELWEKRASAEDTRRIIGKLMVLQGSALAMLS